MLVHIFPDAIDKYDSVNNSKFEGWRCEILKIALICTEKLPVPPVLGGAIQQYIDGILPYLSRYHEVTVFCIANPSLPEQEIVDGVSYIRVPGRNREEYLNNIMPQLKDDIDIVHVFCREILRNLLLERSIEII